MNVTFRNINDFIKDNEMFKEPINHFIQFFEKNFDVDSDKPLCINELEEDNSLIIEWIFKDCRFGFSLESNLDESSYYFVSNKKYGEFMVSGMFNDPFNEKVLKIINDYVVR